MRVLSFIPAFLVAAASFVAAAPATVPTCVMPSDVPAGGMPAVPAGTGSLPAIPAGTGSLPAAPSSTGVPQPPATVPGGVQPPAVGGGDASLQPIISIIVNATTQIQPFSDQLGGLKGDSCTPDAVSGIVVQITAVISTCVVQLQAVAEVDLTGLDLTNLCSCIYALLTLVLTVLNTLVAILLLLGASAVGTLQVVITNLLNAVVGLTGCLKVFITVALTGVLGPAMSLVCTVVDLLLSIVGGLHLVAH